MDPQKLHTCLLFSLLCCFMRTLLFYLTEECIHWLKVKIHLKKLLNKSQKSICWSIWFLHFCEIVFHPHHIHCDHVFVFLDCLYCLWRILSQTAVLALWEGLYGRQSHSISKSSNRKRQCWKTICRDSCQCEKTVINGDFGSDRSAVFVKQSKTLWWHSSHWEKKPWIWMSNCKSYRRLQLM